MIKVSKKEENNKIKEITIWGHACYDDIGKDIVCAAVSSIVITTVNAIEMIFENAINYSDDNKIKIEIVKHDDIIDKLIMNMLNLLKELEEDYPDNIKIL